MIARLSNGPAVPDGQPHLDIEQPVVFEPERWIRMAPVGGAAGWSRLTLDMDPWPGEAVYELTVAGDGQPRAVASGDCHCGHPAAEHTNDSPRGFRSCARCSCPRLREAEVYVYVHAPTFAPNRLWQGKGGAARQKVRIVALEGDGALVFERTAGADRAALRVPGRVLREQLEAAFEPTDDVDTGTVGQS